MKNKCCGTCRIYNWDYAMMFTPLLFVPGYYSWTLLGASLILLLRWEVAVYLHPERFSEATNACLACQNCPEKLCQHKRQLRSFLQKNSHLLQFNKYVITRIQENTEKIKENVKENTEKIRENVKEGTEKIKENIQSIKDDIKNKKNK